MKYKISIFFSKKCKLKSLKNVFNSACYIGNIEIIEKFKNIVKYFEKNDFENALKFAIKGNQLKIINYIYLNFGFKSIDSIEHLRIFNEYSGGLTNHTDYIVYKYLNKSKLPKDLMIKLVYYF
jgi:hypothetical protein